MLVVPPASFEHAGADVGANRSKIARPTSRVVASIASRSVSLQVVSHVRGSHSRCRAFDLQIPVHQRGGHVFGKDVDASTPLVSRSASTCCRQVRMSAAAAAR